MILLAADESRDILQVDALCVATLATEHCLQLTVEVIIYLYRTCSAPNFDGYSLY
jgi:hypothetical protein